MKYLLLVVVLFIVWTGWQKRRQLRERAQKPPAGRPVEDMVACAHCGLLMPHSDSVGDTAVRYCCEAHRRAGPSR